MSIAARRPLRGGGATPAGADVVPAAGAVGDRPAQAYVGLVSRTIAFALDAAAINVVAILVAAVVTVGLSVLRIPDGVRTAIIAVGGAAYALWVVGYFVTFWSTTGQTPGSRVLRIRVVPARGGHLPPGRAVLRFVGVTLAAIPLCAGFLLILVDDRRRGLQDLLARTVVIEAPQDERPG